MEDKLKKALEKSPLELEAWEIDSLQQIVKEQQQEIEHLTQINNTLQTSNNWLTAALENSSEKKETYPYPMSRNEMKRRLGF